jgi:TolB-like protein
MVGMRPKPGTKFVETLRLGTCVLNLNRGSLRDNDGAEIPLRPKSLDLLLTLARNPRRVMSRDELLESVWPNVTVTEDNIGQCVREVRRAIGDPQGRLLRTVVKRGYCLEVEVESESAPAAHAEQTRPSLVVLPFQSIPDDPETEWFADGIVEEITTALSRFRSLFVIARNSAVTFKGQSVDIRDVGRQLGVRYVLEGSVRRAAERVRVTGQLIEAETGSHVWADRFDGVMADVFALQDQITVSVAGVLEPRIRRAEIERATRKPTADLSAYDLYVRAIPSSYARAEAEHNVAKRLLEEAVARDPNFAQARSMLARLCSLGVFAGWEQDVEAARARAIDLAREALASDSSDPLVLARSGLVLTAQAGAHVEGSALLDRAIAANPNCAEAYASGGWVSVFNGDFKTALSRADMSERLDPLSLEAVNRLSLRSAAHFFLHQFDAAIDAAERAIGRAPDWGMARRYLIASLALRGREEEARAHGAELSIRAPQLTLARVRDVSPYRHEWMTDLFVDGLRRGGVAAA